MFRRVAALEKVLRTFNDVRRRSEDVENLQRMERANIMSKSKRPIVGINVEYKSALNGVPGVCYAFDGYPDLVAQSGGIPLLLTPTADPEIVDEYLNCVDALVFVGGGDLDPRNDGFMLHPFVRRMDPRREAFDRALMSEAAKRRVPVLGVGVGMQLLNVSQGGTLFLHIQEDIPRALPHRDAMDPYHRHGLVIEKGTLLDAVYGDADVRVGSAHHMAIDDLAPNFLATARCPGDGVVEAIECARDDWFALGVQFHPESQAATVLYHRIFREFVKGVSIFNETGRNPYAWTPSKPENRKATRRDSSVFVSDVSERLI